MILDEIVADKKIRLVEQKKRIDLCAMRRLAEEQKATGRSFYDNLNKKLRMTDAESIRHYMECYRMYCCFYSKSSGKNHKKGYKR